MTTTKKLAASLALLLGLFAGGCGQGPIDRYCSANRGYCDGTVLMLCSARGTDAYIAADCCDFGAVCVNEDAQGRGCEHSTFARYPGACCVKQVTAADSAMCGQ